MTAFQILNTASELRRAANWLARNQEEKFPLVRKILEDARANEKTRIVLDHFRVTKSSNLNDREFLAEQILVSSIRLQKSVQLSSLRK